MSAADVPAFLLAGQAAGAGEEQEEEGAGEEEETEGAGLCVPA
jgi:hypothetical protein